jgi:DNA polymerase III subunit epsilon
MRQIVLDTETTGLEPTAGHRIIEIGCIELVNRTITGKHYHQYLNPERPIDAGALAVHGLSTDFLSTKPRFAEVVDEFLAFIKGAELVIHNAPFDVGFINSELARFGPSYGQLHDHCTVLDTLAMARQMHPGQRNGLDALCKRYHVDNSHRDLHGALLDAQILAQVYLFMSGGQGALFAEHSGKESKASGQEVRQERQTASLPVIFAEGEELQAHEKYCEFLEKKSGKRLWYTACNSSDITTDGATDDQSGRT